MDTGRYTVCPKAENHQPDTIYDYHVVSNFQTVVGLNLDSVSLSVIHTGTTSIT
jgi:hypothetical protein